MVPGRGREGPRRLPAVSLPATPRPLVMGILNVTPDSFYDGGRYVDVDAAVERGLALVAEGADVVDVGGESTRPGAVPVDERTELARVVPVVAALAGRVRVSVDTTKAAVARSAVDAGATLVNDVSAELYPLAAELGVGWVAMHRRGDPRTMQDAPRYGDVVAEVVEFLAERAAAGRAAGVAEIWLDPGIGFGKTAAHNLALLAGLDRLVAVGEPVLVGTSRKSFLGRIAAASDRRGRSRPGTPPTLGDIDAVAPAPMEDRLAPSLATATLAMAAGARMVRVHDVSATVQAARVVAAAPTPPS